MSDLIEVPASGEATIGSPIKTVQEGIIAFLNTTTIPLGANASFTGSAVDVKDFATISIAVASNVASATNGLRVEFSPDGVHWDHVHAFDVPAGFSLSYNVSTELRYMRVVYNNGASAQSYFRLTTILKRMHVPPSEYTLAQTVRDETLASVTKSIIVGKTTGGGGGYVAVKVNPSGALTGEVSVTESVLPTDAATSTLQTAGNNQLVGLNASFGNSATSAATSDNGTFAFMAFVKRGMQHITSIMGSTGSINTKIPSNLTVTSTRLLVDGSGVTQPITNLSGIITAPHDSIDITYVGATDNINTVVYKNSGVTVATLTMGYDGNGRLSSVTRS